jgi:Bifunctional DNA primase/polymerase, N-terminal
MDQDYPSRLPFGTLGPVLAELGYRCVPIEPGTKSPGSTGWQSPRTVDEYLPRCARWGIGVLTAHTPAIDLDIRDSGLVKILIHLAEEMLEAGPSPIRIGQCPKALLPFSCGEPFDKVVSRWFALPGEDFTAPGFKGHRIEVLGDRQQFVAFAVHPNTGRHYRWVRGSLLTYHAVDLAPINQEQAAAFVRAAEAILLRANMLPLVLSGGRYRLDLPEASPPPPEPRRRRPGDPQTVRVWDFMTPEELAKAIDPTTARRQHDGSWRLRCPVHHGQHTDSLRIAQGHQQAIVWKCFADCSQDDVRRKLSEILR